MSVMKKRRKYKTDKKYLEARSYVLMKYKDECMKCGYTQAGNKGLFVCYIIPRFWNQKEHTHKENLQRLCYNCHAEQRVKQSMLDYRKEKHIKENYIKETKDNKIHKYEEKKEAKKEFKTIKNVILRKTRQ